MVRRKDKEEKIFSVIFGLLLLIITGFLIFSSWKVTQKRKELLFQIEKLKREIELLQKENQKLEQGITESDSQDYWEERLREQGYKKPGEIEVVIKKEGTAEKNVPPQGFLENFIAQVRGLLK